jgi:putative transposase
MIVTYQANASRPHTRALSSRGGAFARRAFYRQRAAALAPVAPEPGEVVLRNALQRVCLEWPAYGYLRVTQELRRRGHAVNHKRVLRLMREDNLLALRRRAWVRTTDSAHALLTYPNLTRELAVSALNQLWVADITYIRLLEEFVYLAIVLDAFSRRVIGWALEAYLDAELALAALRMALAARAVEPGLIHHSDRGVQYASTEYTELLHTSGIRISMSRRGNPYDNAQCERFMRTLKYEEVYLSEYETRSEARASIKHFLEEVYKLRHRRASAARPDVQRIEYRRADCTPACQSTGRRKKHPSRELQQ